MTRGDRVKTGITGFQNYKFRKQAPTNLSQVYSRLAHRRVTRWALLVEHQSLT